MADTGSDPCPRGARLTLRLRLTLLYGTVFLAAGAGLLAITYGLFKHSQNAQSHSVSVSAVEFKVPSGAALNALVGPGWIAKLTRSPARPQVRATGSSGSFSGTFTHARAGVNTVPVGPQSKLLKAIQSSGQKQLSSKAQQIVRHANLELRAQQVGDASSLLEWSAIALGVVALLSIGLAWWLSGRALRPLRTMNTRAREISAENLHQRLGVEGRGDELGELARTFDALLARLESSFESQRRFVANASHELRTPITLERTLVEVALADPDPSVESLRRVCERIVASTEEQERLLDALLTLARSEAGVAAGESADLALLVEEALLERGERLRGISLESRLEPARLIGDQALLERLVGNLIDNAILHNAGNEPWIRVSTEEKGGAAELRIANGGAVVESAAVSELFEPFRRGAGERLGSEHGGLGLGLSIVRAVAVAHAAEVEGRALPGGGLEFELRFASAGGTAEAEPPRSRVAAAF